MDFLAWAAQLFTLEVLLYSLTRDVSDGVDIHFDVGWQNHSYWVELYPNSLFSIVLLRWETAVTCLTVCCAQMGFWTKKQHNKSTNCLSPHCIDTWLELVHWLFYSAACQFPICDFKVRDGL